MFSGRPAPADEAWLAPGTTRPAAARSRSRARSTTIAASPTPAAPRSPADAAPTATGSTGRWANRRRRVPTSTRRCATRESSKPPRTPSRSPRASAPRVRSALGNTQPSAELATGDAGSPRVAEVSGGPEGLRKHRELNAACRSSTTERKSASIASPILRNLVRRLVLLRDRGGAIQRPPSAGGVPEAACSTRAGRG